MGVHSSFFSICSKCPSERFGARFFPEKKKLFKQCFTTLSAVATWEEVRNEVVQTLKEETF
jgi:hypothetical protein